MSGNPSKLQPVPYRKFRCSGSFNKSGPSLLRDSDCGGAQLPLENRADIDMATAKNLLHQRGPGAEVVLAGRFNWHRGGAVCDA